MKKRFFLIFIFPLILFAQTGPGGVEENNGASNLQMWFQGELGVYEDLATDVAEDNDQIAKWDDVSGNGYNLTQSNTVKRPRFIENVLNNYDVMRFDGSNDDLTNLSVDAFQNNYSIFIVGYASSTRGDFFGVIFPITGTPDIEHGILVEAAPSNRLRFLHRTNISTLGGDNIEAGTASRTQSEIMSFSRAFGGRQQYWINGADNQSRTAAGANFTEVGQVVVGSLAPDRSARFLRGDIAELIVMSKEVNAAERIMVENYLSAKYDIDLAANDFYDQDDAANGNYDHDVAGIGRVSATAAHLDSQGTGIVRVSNPAGVSNGEYLFWGRDLKSGIEPTFYYDTAGSITRLNTTWRVTEIGSTGTDDFSFDITGVPSHTLPAPCAGYRLIVDSQPDFNSGARREYPLNISGTTASTAVAANHFQDGDYFTIAVDDLIVYTGTQWYSGSGIINRPDSTDYCKNMIVRSGSNVTVPNDFHVNSITLEPGAILNIAAGYKVTVENGLNLGTGSILNLETDAQLMQNHTGANINTGDGELIVRQQGTGVGVNYNYWSSPVNVGGVWSPGNLRDNSGAIVQWTPYTAGNPDPSTTPITLSSRWLYSFNATTNNYDQWSYLGPSGTLTPGFAYSMKGSGTGTDYEYDFRGFANNGDISLTVASGGNVLIGNPYPSALDIDQFLSDNLATTTATAYFYEQFASNSTHNLGGYRGGYATRNMMMGVAAVADASGLTSGSGTASKPAPGQFTAVAQGFFVAATGTTISFNNSQRSLANEGSGLGSVFYRAPGSTLPASSGDTRPKITFAFEKPQAFKSYFGLGYDQRATYGVDNGFDAYDYNSASNSILWDIASDPYVIQSLGNINSNDILPLAVSVQNPGTYILSIDSGVNIPSGMEVYLYDSMDDIDYPLHIQPATLNLPLLDDNSTRYSIRFRPTTTLSYGDFEADSLNVSYINDGRYLFIENNSSQEITQAHVYSISGQLVYKLENLTSNQSPLDLSSGVYLVQVELQDGYKVTKKILVQ